MRFPLTSCHALLLVLLGGLAYPAVAQDLQRLQGVTGGLGFAENRGQWSDDVLFQARLGGATAWVTADGVVFDFYEGEREEVDRLAWDARVPGHKRTEAMSRGHVVRMRFEGAWARRVVGRGPHAAYHNYFLGSDPSRWASRVPLYDEVVLEGLYDGVDLRLYDDGGHLRYDLVLAPGAEASRIRMRMEGADGVTLTAGGALRVQTALGPVEHRGLTSYQEGPSGRREVVESAFALGADGAVGFAVGAVDPARALVIDPLVWATFLGGSSFDEAEAVATGEDGSVVVAGSTRSADFPTTTGAYDPTYNGDPDAYDDAFVSRLAPDGASLHWSTFLGGAEWDGAIGVSASAGHGVTAAGSTFSPDFPTTPGAYDDTFNGGSFYGDAFVARLSPDGASLLWATYVGGSGDDIPSGLAVGADGSATIAGSTPSLDFPATPGAFDTDYNGGHVDGFVARVSPDGGALLYATYLGGAEWDEVNALAVGAGGATTLTGYVRSPDFPTTPDAYDPSYNGGGFPNAFVTRLSPDGGALVYSTFLGTFSYAEGVGLAVGADGSATVVGHTRGADFPTTPGSYDPTHNGDADVFVTRLSPDGSHLVYSTFLGGTFSDVARHVALRPDGGAVVVGYTQGYEFPTTPGAFDTTPNGYTDAFVARLSPGGSALLYATFLGGRRHDYVRAVALGPDERATIVGETRSEDFPVTPGAFDTTHGGPGGDGFVAQLDVAPDPALLSLAVSPLNSPVPHGGRLLVHVALTNNTPTPLRGDLALEVTGPDGSAYAHTLTGDGTLEANATRTPTYGLPVFDDAPVGLYAGVVKALVEGTTLIGEAAFTFEVTARGDLTARRAPNGSGPAFGPVEELDGGGLGERIAPGVVQVSLDEAVPAVVPNPATDHASIAFALAGSSEVRLALYDALGRQVAVVEAGELEAGEHRLALDVSALPAGTYVWRLVAGERVEAGRLTVAR